VHNYVSVIIDIWAIQKNRNQNSYFNSRDTILKAIVRIYANRKYIWKREQFLDRATKILQKNYNKMKIEEIVHYC
jgi:hypothetical protein